jgi:hypothetical protein
LIFKEHLLKRFGNSVRTAWCLTSLFVLISEDRDYCTVLTGCASPLPKFFQLSARAGRQSPVCGASRQGAHHTTAQDSTKMRA